MDGRIDGTNNVDPHQQHRFTPYTRELGCNRQPIKKKDFNRESDRSRRKQKKETRNEVWLNDATRTVERPTYCNTSQTEYTYVRTYSNQNCPSGSVQISIARKE